ncbi:MAG: hypothetical protein LBM99_04350 [Bacillales bacterium]|jgi:hypothetical protein|nr:hypothetical protein [Bacillales bacterium]
MKKYLLLSLLFVLISCDGIGWHIDPSSFVNTKLLVEKNEYEINEEIDIWMRVKISQGGPFLPEDAVYEIVDIDEENKDILTIEYLTGTIYSDFVKENTIAIDRWTDYTFLFINILLTVKELKGKYLGGNDILFITKVYSESLGERDLEILNSAFASGILGNRLKFSYYFNTEDNQIRFRQYDVIAEKGTQKYEDFFKIE